MKDYKELNISGTLLDNVQLEKYMEKIASEHNICNCSDSKTYPLQTLKNKYHIILETYNLLSRHIKLGIKIHSAGEWILDNFYIIEENVKAIQKELTLKKYKEMPGISNGKYKGFSRTYVLASEIVAFTDCKIDADNVNFCLKAYQKKKLLSMQEIWDLSIFLKLALVSQISEMCEKIYLSQMQKLKVENIIKKVIEKQENNEYKIGYKIQVNDSEPKYPFIEYMSYKLKEYGKEAIEYQKILEKEVAKLGMTVSEVIQKEHFQIANIKITIGNGIKSLKEIGHINFGELFTFTNATEEILNLDPAKVYPNMDEESKNYYREKISKISKKSKISEVYISEKIIELAKRYADKVELEEKRKSHIGYYLIDKGIYELKDKLEIKQEKNNINTTNLYIASLIFIPIYFCFCLGIIAYSRYKDFWMALILSVALYIPITEIFTKFLNYVLSKCKKPEIFPKMNYEDGLPKEAATFVVIPTILKSKEKVAEMLKKLEVYYLANKLENVYFALLGDCSEEKTQNMFFDEEIIREGERIVNQLNEKYQTNTFSRFHFLYRNRVWNDSEKSYIGWERKRGLLVTFNEYILRKKENNFAINTIENEKEKLPDIKYIITLDSDTNLIMDSVSKLVGAMDHILNQPIIKKQKVVKGYGIMQPRIGLDLEIAQKTYFVELFSMQGGIDLYSNAISDIYQDYFKEGIFTGKGIYNLKVYDQILKDEIPENTVLSHDLLEGNYLRCGLLTDVTLMDGYPLKYIPYIKRNHRWVRGDWQIFKWLFNDKLNEISKFKIYDNLRRSLVNIVAFILIVIGSICLKEKMLSNILIWVSVISLIISYCLDILNIIVFKESYIEGEIYADKKFSKDIGNSKKSIIRFILQIAFLPYEAYENFDAIIRSIYRMKKKNKLLEWVTAEDGEKQSKSDLKSIYKEMFINVVFGVIFLFNKYTCIFAILWLLGPAIAWYISLSRETKRKISYENEKYLIDVAKRTWSFFENYITPENHYLMIDNYQEDREKLIVNRTSSTNIGLSIIAVISAYDLKFISFEQAENYIENIIGTINNLAKWNGHLYNWYDTKTLAPLIPRYISTVDSGNYVGYLYILKEFLIENKEKGEFDFLIKNVENLINDVDFSVLYSKENRLFSIGFNLEENKLTDSYYDFLASEARQASLIAIAKKDVPSKHWSSLSRTLTSLKGYKGLISWSGTAFEYLMPNINLKNYQGSLIDESSKFAVMCQIEYAKKLNVPWGISESAYSLKDLYNNYQYKAFGIPWLGLKRGLENDIVISPYSTFLALDEANELAIKNAKELEKIGAYQEFGFYESVDFTKSRMKKNQKYELVKTYMAHHQALILLSINNYLNDEILKKRFNKNAEIEAVDILLQERMPINMILTKEYKEKIANVKFINESAYSERIIQRHHQIYRNLGVIANENYRVIMDDLGNSWSEFKENLVYKYKSTDEGKQGVFFYVKNVKNKNIIDVYKDSNVIFAPDKISYVKNEGKLKLSTSVILDPNKALEIRKIEIENIGSTEEIYELVSEFEPILSKKMQEYSHPAFNKLFLQIEKSGEVFYITRRNRLGEEDMCLGTTLYTDNEQIVDTEYEIDKEKYYGRDNIDIPDMLRESKKFSNEMKEVTDLILAIKKTFKILPGEKVEFSMLLMSSFNKDYLKEEMKKLLSTQEIYRIIDVAKVRSDEELQFLQIKRKELALYQKMLDYIFLSAPNYKMSQGKKHKKDYLWRYGISGDNPIISVKLRKMEEVNGLKQILKAYEYFRAKSILIDLIIIDEEENIYEKYVLNSIDELISEKQMQYLRNIKGGIFVLESSEKNKQELETIILKSKLIIDLGKTDLESYIEKIGNRREKSYKKLKNISLTNNTTEILPLKKEDLLYFNGYGGFTLDGKEYHIYTNKQNRTPFVWSHILANKFFGTLLTDNFSGYTWSKNSRLNRLTAWGNKPISNLPPEIWYVVEDNNVWTVNSGVIPNENYYYINYGFGYAEFKNTNNELVQEIKTFIPQNESFKVNSISLKNIANKLRNLKLLIYIKPVLGEDEILTNTNIEVCKKDNIIIAKNILREDIYDKTFFVTSDLEISNFTGNKDIFLGKEGTRNPRALYEKLDGKNGLGKNSCIALELEIELKPYENKEFAIILGEEKEENIAQNTSLFFDKIDREKALDEVRKNWNNIVQTLTVSTPSKSINLLINGWLIYQTLSSRIYGRTGFYQSGGAYGFRDQLQDSLGMKFIDSNILKEQIINCAGHQFIEGDVLHWWHSDTKRGIRTRFSDDLLWLVYATLEYMEFTNDYSILDTEVEYLSGEELKTNELEVYNIFYNSEIKENIYSHCNRAIEKVIARGIEPFPKIGTGDWNDGFSDVGSKGNGQSVWLGFFLYDILNRWNFICTLKNDEERAKRYSNLKEKLKKSLNTEAWDGRWYKRAITDDGQIIGSMNSEEAKIDSLSQSWSVISGAGDNDKKFIALDSVKNNLVDYDNQLIKLFDPPFEKGSIKPGYIRGYKPGVRENGGQYTHAAIWFIMAEALLGFGDEAVKLLELINPINHTNTPEKAQKYKLEPYSIAADVYSNKDLIGRGGWSLYTGSSSWYYKVTIENILGLKLKNGYLYIEPCISKEWKEYEIRYKYKTSIYQIKVKNPNGKNTGVSRFILNGKEMEEKRVMLQDDGKINTIDIFM